MKLPVKRNIHQLRIREINKRVRDKREDKMSRVPASVTKEVWEKLIRKDKVDEVEGYCFLCGKKVNELAWCFGCEAFICEECNVTHVAGFDHIPRDHKEKR